MHPMWPDTTPDAERVQIELLRRLSGAERIELARRAGRAADTMALARLQAQYPGDTPRDRQLRLGALKIPRELMIAAFDWDPVERGR